MRMKQNSPGEDGNPWMSHSTLGRLQQTQEHNEGHSSLTVSAVLFKYMDTSGIVFFLWVELYQIDHHLLAEYLQNIYIIY